LDGIVWSDWFNLSFRKAERNVRGGELLIPFIAALLSGAGTIIDKIALTKRRIPLRQFIPFVFLYLFFFTALVTPYLGSVNFNLLLSPQFLFLFLVMILLAITWNIFYYESLGKEELYEFETIVILTPLVTIVLSWLFFPETWDVRVGWAALVAAAALVASHWEKHHLSLNHYSLNLMVAVLLMATEDIIVTELLRDHVFSPVGLYVIRTFILFSFFFAYYRPNVATMNRKNLNIIGLTGLLGAAFMILKFYGYRNLGIPYTSLVIVAAPIAIYIASAYVMKERMKVKVLVAAAVIALAIIYATSIYQTNLFS
jgi:drug/metabolite transporter (DMT)-like permease